MLGKIQSNPYFKLHGKFRRGTVENTEYLTDEEVQRIMKLEPTPGSMMEQARDLFVFQCWTGLAYQDAQAFDFTRYKKVDGEWRLTASRIKTGEPFVSQLLPPAVDVLKKYNMQTPKIVNAVYNRELHSIGMACGIHTRLHSHIARHTFATYMLRHGVPLQNVSRMLGHTNIKQTLRYAKVLAEDVHSDFARIAELLK
jgi:integrase